MRLFAVECARSVQHLMTDQRSIDALDVAERFADGLATQVELAAARNASRAAADGAAGNAADGAAWATTWNDVRNAVAAASRYAALDAQANLFILMCAGAL